MISICNVKAILTDIEGTTSSISFVKDILFPYARERIPDYIRENEHRISGILDDVRAIEKSEHFNREDIIEVLLRWMDSDLKITPLKTLQGMIWQVGYETGALKGHVYEDAMRALSRWHGQGLRLYVYSSGSVAAQKLLFSYTNHGNLTPLFSGYFDTTAGSKLASDSYRAIAEETGFPPAQILFLSDNPGEITAAAAAGLQTVLVDREGVHSNSVKNFDDISLLEMAA